MVEIVGSLLLIAAFAFSPYLFSMVFGTRGERFRSRVNTRLHPYREPEPANRPIEEIAADVRRRGLKLRALPPHASYVKQAALASAYDLVLAECCASLGTSHLLTVLSPGPELDAERRRVELLLHSYGVPIADAA